MSTVRGPLARALAKATEDQAKVVYELLRGYLDSPVSGPMREEDFHAYTLEEAMTKALKAAQPVQPRCIPIGSGPGDWVVVPDESDQG